jgi:hypothetical protein
MTFSRFVLAVSVAAQAAVGVADTQKYLQTEQQRGVDCPGNFNDKATGNFKFVCDEADTMKETGGWYFHGTNGNISAKMTAGSKGTHTYSKTRGGWTPSEIVNGQFELWIEIQKRDHSHWSLIMTVIRNVEWNMILLLIIIW